MALRLSMANIETLASKPGLLRQLGFYSATALVISNMIGTGIFATTGYMAGDLGSAGLILACWAVGALFAVAGALSYVVGLVTGIVFLVLQPYNQNRTIRFHAFQSIFYHVSWIIFWFGLHIVLVTLGFGLLGALFGLLSMLISLVIGFGGFLLWLYLMWRAYNNNPLVLPIIGPIAQQQAAKM